MHVRSRSQFFRITTEIKLGLHAFDKSRLVMTFLIKLWVTEILCSFWFVLEWKIGGEITESSRLEFQEKFIAKNFALSDAEDNIPGLLNRGSIADLPLLKILLTIHQKFRGPSFWEVITSFTLLEYATLATLSELYFRFRRSVLLVQTKKVIAMS